ncbi:unnamed protein product, partial [Protopolystoma xenopodis]
MDAKSSVLPWREAFRRRLVKFSRRSARGHCLATGSRPASTAVSPRHHQLAGLPDNGASSSEDDDELDATAGTYLRRVSRLRNLSGYYSPPLPNRAGQPTVSSAASLGSVLKPATPSAGRRQSLSPVVAPAAASSLSQSPGGARQRDRSRGHATAVAGTQRQTNSVYTPMAYPRTGGLSMQQDAGPTQLTLAPVPVP